MADRELRHMSRTELIEIIFALKQSEDSLKAENAELRAQLQDRTIKVEQAGSIAQAALELNKVFEAAQAAADEYLLSVRAAVGNTQDAADSVRTQAQTQAEQLLAGAQADAEALRERTRQECRAMTEEAERRRSQTEADCKAMRAKAEQEVQARWSEFDRRASQVLDHYSSIPVLPEEDKGKTE